MKKTLYSRRKGKEMHASGTWKATQGEQTLMNVIITFFTISVIAVLISMFVHKTWFTVLSIVCCAVAFISMFVVMFGIVFLKNKEEPMETEYYDVDYTYNGISGETEDKTREITEEEFFDGKKAEDNS